MVIEPQDSPVTGSNNCFCEAAIKSFFFLANIYEYFKLHVLTFANGFPKRTIVRHVEASVITMVRRCYDTERVKLTQAHYY
jgi:hypothetical protein